MKRNTIYYDDIKTVLYRFVEPCLVSYLTNKNDEFVVDGVMTLVSEKYLDSKGFVLIHSQRPYQYCSSLVVKDIYSNPNFPEFEMSKIDNSYWLISIKGVGLISNEKMTCIFLMDFYNSMYSIIKESK